jgi:hypothetical protein
MSTSKKAVLVTTEFRGVFFGYVSDDKKAPTQLTLKGARNCIYWSADVGGFLGLASNGPNRNCRIGRTIKEITLYKITSVTAVEKDAVNAWESASVYEG